jgi:hypothetical protein
MLDGLRNIFSPTFVPYSDPKATIPLGTVLKNEWFDARHPTRGIVPPAMFLPGAGSDAMHALTERVILTALGDWEDFTECGVPIRLSVNVPVSALVDLPIPRMLREARPSAESWSGLTPEVTKTRSFMIYNLRKTLRTRCENSSAISRLTISAPATLRLSASRNCPSAS